MATGVFGSIRPANINPSNDVDMFYFYRPTRSTEADDFSMYKKLPASECLTSALAEGENDTSISLYGVYNLRLPLEYFNAKGFYTIYIRPKEIQATIIDVSVLAAYTDTKGIVFNNGSNGELAGISDLTGYRIDFSDGAIRLITSCNKCEPVVVNTGDSYPKTTRYRLVDTASNYVFCTVTPSSTLAFKSTSSPYIGKAGEVVRVSNTKFSPKLIEIEMVDHDADTISYMLEGNQVRDRDKGIITTYNNENEIYHQADYYTLKDKLGNPLYDVKQKRDTIDSSQAFDNIVGD